MKNLNFKSLTLCLTMIAGLSACNSGTTTVISGCNAPKFTPQLGATLLNNWGNQVQKWSTTSENNSDIYINAGYFTMSNYVSDAILVPTVSNVQRDGTNEIYDYFTHFLAKKPIITLPNTESNVFQELDCGYGTGSGYYDFDLTDPDTGLHSKVAARFTFIYKYEPATFAESFVVESGMSTGTQFGQSNTRGWYISTQNSAVLPPQS